MSVPHSVAEVLRHQIALEVEINNRKNHEVPVCPRRPGESPRTLVRDSPRTITLAGSGMIEGCSSGFARSRSSRAWIMSRALLVIDVQNEYFTGALPVTNNRMRRAASR
jgi:hypothetical protein